MNKVKKIFIIFGSIFLAIVLMLLCYRQYCIYQTKNIYEEFKRIFIYQIFEDYDRNLETRVIRYKNDIKGYGTNCKGHIKKWSPYIYGEKGSISCNITIDFYDDNNSIVYSSNYFDHDNIIIIKKIKETWIIDRIKTIP